MVIAAFFISTAVILLALGAVQGAQRQAREKEREAFEAELQTFLTDAKATDHEHGHGLWNGLPVEVTLGHFSVDFSVQLDSAVLPYADLVARFASPELKRTLTSLGVTVDAKDHVTGSVPREPGLGENLTSVMLRLGVVDAIRALRSHAPGELLGRIDRAHSSYEVDQILIALTQHFPDAPETQDAIELAAEREHGSPDRVRRRAEQWWSARAAT